MFNSICGDFHCCQESGSLGKIMNDFSSSTGDELLESKKNLGLGAPTQTRKAVNGEFRVFHSCHLVIACLSFLDWRSL